jgi:hypothetical protein
MIDLNRICPNESPTHDDFRAVLLSIASGDAPSEQLRILCLRAYKGIDVHGMALEAVVPTDEERVELDRLHAVASRQVRH